MTFSTHDEIAAEALRLADKIRTDPRELHEDLAKWCRDEPEKAAQVLMCFAAWTDPDDPDALGDRAESVAEATAIADERSAPSRPVFVEVILREDITTPTGILPKASRHLGLPEPGGMWSVWVAGTRIAAVPESAINAGRRHRSTLLKAEHAKEEYWFARQWLSYDHDSAVRWLEEQYRVSLRQLERWGLSMTALGVSA
ncbi:hypothetical protein [Nocardia sp. NPDC004260]